MRLIDADELKEQFSWSEVCRLSIKEINQIIDDAPTITPDKGDSDCTVSFKDNTRVCGNCNQLIFRDYNHCEGFCSTLRTYRSFYSPCYYEEEIS